MKTARREWISGTETWSCMACGAVVTVGSWPTHVKWHDSILEFMVGVNTALEAVKNEFNETHWKDDSGLTCDSKPGTMD